MALQKSDPISEFCRFLQNVDKMTVWTQCDQMLREKRDQTFAEMAHKVPNFHKMAKKHKVADKPTSLEGQSNKGSQSWS